MPKEIEKQPEDFSAKINCVRASFDEIVTLFETIGIETTTIRAISNNAIFDGLTDIKSAPARFSGEPQVEVSKQVNEETVAFATIDFKKYYTKVSAGEMRRYSPFSEKNNEFAKQIHREILPLSNPLEFWFSWIVAASLYLGIVLIGASFFIVGLDFDSLDGAKFYGVTLPSNFSDVLLAVYFFSLIARFLLNRRLPVAYNPRATFWQRHGGTALATAIGSVLTALVVWFFSLG